MAGRQHRGHLAFGFRQRHQQRQLAVGGQAVAFIRHRVLAVVQQRVRRQQRRQRGPHLGLARGAVAGLNTRHGGRGSDGGFGRGEGHG